MVTPRRRKAASQLLDLSKATPRGMIRYYSLVILYFRLVAAAGRKAVLRGRRWRRDLLHFVG